MTVNKLGLRPRGTHMLSMGPTDYALPSGYILLLMLHSILERGVYLWTYGSTNILTSIKFTLRFRLSLYMNLLSTENHWPDV